MTKSELIKKISEKSGVPQGSVKKVLDVMFRPGKGIISITLKGGDKVTISGFGTFFARKRSQRTARNPRNGVEVKVPKRNYPAFKPAKSFKESIK